MPVFEPRWIPLSVLRFHLKNPIFLNRLSDQGSLTQRLIEYCDGDFSVRLVGQHLQIPTLSESLLLGILPGTQAVIREVELLCHSQPVVFARTIMPKSSLKGRAMQLKGLGNRPLGAVLFSDPTTRRITVEYAKIMPGKRLYTSASRSQSNKTKPLWGRRTLFEYAGSRLLVNEIFLPGIQS